MDECGNLSVAQLVERGTVNGITQQRSLGRWFESIPGDHFFGRCIIITITKHSKLIPFAQSCVRMAERSKALV